MTCPHGIIIGGFSSVACSLETGQTKMEWNRYEGGRGISTWNYVNWNLSTLTLGETSYRKLILRRPFGALGFHNGLEL
jgi:hypothetical protein